MDDQPLSDDESFHNEFFYFIKAVEVLSMDAAAQREVMNNFNVAWEVQHDALDGGTALISRAGNYLSEAEKSEIAKLLEQLSELPKASLGGDHDEAMSHSAWMEIRCTADRLSARLSDAVRRNHEFFKSPIQRE